MSGAGFYGAGSGGGGGGTATAAIIYKPGGVSSGNLKATWAEVDAAIVAANGALRVYIDDSIVSPAPITSVVDCKGYTEFFAYKLPLGGGVFANIVPGAQLINPRSVSDALSIQATPGALDIAPVVVVSRILFLFRGGQIRLLAGAGRALIDVAPGDVLAVISQLDGAIISDEPTVAAVALGTGAQLFVVSQIQLNFQFNNYVSGDGTTATLLLRDSSLAPNPSLPLFTGTFIPQFTDIAAQVSYDDNLVPPNLGSGIVQGAIDALKLLTAPTVSSVIMFGAGDITNTITDRYLFPSYDDDVAPLNPISFRIPFNGLLKNMRIYQTGNGNGNNITYTLRKNSGDASLAVTMQSTDANGSDLVNTENCTPSDLFAMVVRKGADIATSPSNIVITLELDRT